MDKPKFEWYDHKGYNRCIIEELNVMLTVTNDLFGFYNMIVWHNNKRYQTGQFNSKQKALATAEMIALKIYIGLES